MNELAQAVISINDIAFQITEIQTPVRADIKSAIDSLNRSPTADSFWKLSRLIRLAPPTEVKPVIDQIAKLVLNNRSSFIGAAFANAHLLRLAHQISYPDGYKWCRNFCFTNNIVWNAQLYNIISLPTYSNILTPQYNLLDSYSIEVQKIASASIARHSKTPGNLLRRVLATISNKPATDVELLQLSDITNSTSDAKFYRLRGLVLLASFLTSNQVTLTEYKNALMPILHRIPESEAEKSLSITVQKLLSKLMISNPSSFHNIKIFDAAIVQVKANNFTPEFLEGIIYSFGLFAFKKFIIPFKLIPIWLDSLKKRGIEFIKIISPYVKYLHPDLQLEIHKSMVELCERSPFNEQLFNTTTLILMGSHPTISPYMGRFIESAKNSAFSRNIMSKLKPILEPKVQPLLHPMRELMKVKELEKRDAFVQFHPTVDCKNEFKSVSINCDMSREILFLSKIQEAQKKSTPLFNFSKPIVKNETKKDDMIVDNKDNNTADTSVNVANEQKSEIQISNINDKKVEESSSDSEISLNLDGPDSDDAE